MKQLTVDMYGYTTEDGEQVSKPTKDVEQAQRVVLYFNKNNGISSDNTDAKQAFCDISEKHSFVGECKDVLDKDTGEQTGWRIEKSNSVVWSVG